MRQLWASVAFVIVVSGISACGPKTAVVNTTRADLATLESTEPALAGALAALRERPDAEGYLRAGETLAGLGVRDQALELLNTSVRLDGRNALAYEARARIWRDWGLPERALEDVKDAVRLAPQSPVVRNTAGTVFFALGQHAEARRYFGMALSLDPSAAYAANNLCYVAFLAGDLATAEARCRQALALSPDVAAARENLALIYAGVDMRLSEQELVAGAAGDAQVRYNLGILHLARREPAEALAAFEAACIAEPPFRDACERAAQTRRLLKEK
jgi:tetratricopeptide (TPR) repeat protein